MENEQNEANNDFESKADEFLSKEVTETPTDSSTETKPGESTEQQTETTSTELDKTELVKEAEADGTLSAEDRIAKVKEILGDDLEAIDAYVKEKGYHNDPAWQKQRELIDRLKQEGEAKTALSQEDKAGFDEFKVYRNSAEYIQSTMKAQGFTQEKIDAELKEKGYEVQGTSQDVVNSVVQKMGLDINNLTQQEKTYVDEVAKISKIVIDEELNRRLPKELAPLQENIENRTKSDNATSIVTTMKETVKTEGILDFDKDVEPELNKYMDEHPDALQSDVMEHFKSINHSLTVERLKTGKNKEERDDKRNQIRHNTPAGVANANMPNKTGDFDKDADAFFGTVNL